MLKATDMNKETITYGREKVQDLIKHGPGFTKNNRSQNPQRNYNESKKRLNPVQFGKFLVVTLGLALTIKVGYAYAKDVINEDRKSAEEFLKSNIPAAQKVDKNLAALSDEKLQQAFVKNSVAIKSEVTINDEQVDGMLFQATKEELKNHKGNVDDTISHMEGETKQIIDGSHKDYVVDKTQDGESAIIKVREDIEKDRSIKDNR